MNSDNQLEHLNESARRYVFEDDKERIRYIRSTRWIGYSKAKAVIDKLEDLLEYPQRNCMPNMLLVGEPDTGKTMIVNRFLELNPGYELQDNEGVVIPALFIHAPPVPSQSRLYCNILERMFAPYNESDPLEKKKSHVLAILRGCNVKMLIIDEIHSVLTGSLEKQRRFINAIRDLGKELQIPIVCIGTKESLRVIKIDEQSGSHFRPITLSKWVYGTDFRRLLASFECMTPLQLPSNLHGQQISRKLFAMSGGVLGQVSEIISEAAIMAIKSHKERIDLELLQSLEWISLSERKMVNEC